MKRREPKLWQRLGLSALFLAAALVAATVLIR